MPPPRPKHPALRRPVTLLLALGLALLGGRTALGEETPARPPAPPPAAAIPVPSLREEMRRLVSAARDRVLPALVNIEVVTVQYYGGSEYKRQAVGSGTIISPDGYVVTNYHVTMGGRRFRCTLADKQELPARLVGEDPLTDLAVLALDLSAYRGARDPQGRVTVPVAQWGDSDQLEVGDTVMAMGSPLALSSSVTLGIVSNAERVFAQGLAHGDADEMELERGQRTGIFTRWIQHDALINPGNSGGSLVNLAGELIGVNELGGAAMGFAIPSNLARQVAAALIASGEVVRSWTGLSFEPIAETGIERGVLVETVVKESPGDAAGIRAGDVLLAIDGEAVDVRFPEEVPLLAKRLADLTVGSRLALAYARDGVEGRATLTTTKLDSDSGEQAAFRGWGFTGQAITPKMARDLRLGGREGVLVTGVRAGGPAQLAEPPLAAGDVVRGVDQQRVRSLDELVTLYERLALGEVRPVLVDLDRKGRSQLTVLEPRDDDDVPPPRELPKAWIGIATQPLLRELAAALGMPEARGLRITRVYPGTRAAAAGLRVGDLIVALDGEALAPSGMEEAELLARRVRRLPIERSVTLAVLRDGQRRELVVALERSRMPPEEAPRHEDRDFEVTAREITFFDRDENRWDDDVHGVLVEQVEEAGWAGLGGVRPGDLIQRIGDRGVTNLESWRQALGAVKEQRPERVVVVALRGARTEFFYLEPEWKPVPT